MTPISNTSIYAPSFNSNNSMSRSTPSLAASIPLYRVEGYDYRDYSQVDVKSIKEIIQPPKCKRNGPRGGVATPFPVKLYEMLEAVENEGMDHIVSWQPHGRCFIIHNSQSFLTEVMPRFFKQSKLTSFQRQLNLYGFQRLNSGVDRDAYYHELFLRGRHDLCTIMLRKKVSGRDGLMPRSGAHVTETTFYCMPRCPPPVTENEFPSPIPSPLISNDETAALECCEMRCVSPKHTGMSKTPIPVESWVEENHPPSSLPDEEFEAALSQLLSGQYSYLEQMQDIKDDEIEPTPLLSQSCTDASNNIMASTLAAFSQSETKIGHIPSNNECAFQAAVPVSPYGTNKATSDQVVSSSALSTWGAPFLPGKDVNEYEATSLHSPPEEASSLS